MKELTVAADIGNLHVVTDFVDAFLEEIDCPMKKQMQIDLAVDEVFTNICSYAYGNGEGEACIRIGCEEDPRAVMITFADSGLPFNPLTQEEPDTTLPIDERLPGGLGIFLVRKMMDEVLYEYRSGKNILHIRKRL